MPTHFDQKPFTPSDWISQAEAAQLRRVSRQAIWKLVQKGRIRSVEIGGHILVYRADVEAFQPKDAGRPKSLQKENKNDRG